MGFNEIDWNVWVFVEYCKYNDVLSGDFLDFVVGVDCFINDEIMVGFLFGYSWMDFIDGINILD